MMNLILLGLPGAGKEHKLLVFRKVQHSSYQPEICFDQL